MNEIAETSICVRLQIGRNIDFIGYTKILYLFDKIITISNSNINR